MIGLIVGVNKLMAIEPRQILTQVLKFEPQIQHLIADLYGKPVSKKMAEAVENFRRSKKFFDETLSDESKAADDIKLFEAAKGLSGAIFYIAHVAKTPEHLSEETRNAILADCDDLNRELDALELFSLSEENLDSEIVSRSKRILAELSFNERMPELSVEQKRVIDKSILRVAGLESYVESLELSVVAELGRTKDIYDEALANFEKKKRDIDDLLGVISGTAVAGSYEKNAEHEIKAADFLRAISVVLMSFVVALVSLSFYEINTGVVSVESILVKIGLIFLVSVPAAYMARESSRHRSMYYEYIQRSLDLRAFDPYIASLSNDEQSRLKSEMAVGFFSKSRSSDLDTYPINVHELLMELIKRVDKK